MTSKDINYRITADPSKAGRGFKSAEDSARALERELNKLEAQQRKVNDASTKVGTALLAGGAAIAAGLALSAKAAIDWETAWTGVTKVVSGTPAQMAALEDQIRGLTLVLPATHDEIAAVAAAAGQLGVKRQDIAEFTKVMVDLGYATNLSAEDAAFSLAKLMSIMQTAPQNVDRLGATIVNLGNNFATTEADITEMGLRIAGAGHVIGLSEAQVLAYATALSAVGIEAQAGGTAISRAFIGINQAVLEGGDKLDKFAAVAGVTADQFKQKFQKDAAGAMADFVAGLGRMNKAGGDVFGTLDDLGLSEIRVRDAMLRLSGAGDLLNQTLQVANQGWSEDTALMNEVNKRYDTVAAKMQMAKNSIDDLGISLGQTLLPALGAVADNTKYLMEFINDLPGPVKTAAEIVAGLTAVFLLLTGTVLVGIPMLARYRAAVEVLANSEGKLAAAALFANNALSKGGPIMIAISAAVAVATAAFAAFGIAQEKAKANVDEVIATLDKQTGAVTQDTRVWAAHELETRGVAEAADDAGVSLSALTDAVLGNADAMEDVTRQVQMYFATTKDNAYQQLQFINNLAALHGEVTNGQAAWKRQKEAVGEDKDAMAKLSPAAQQLASDLGLDANKADDLTGGLKELDDAFNALIDSVFGLQNAQGKFYEDLDKLTKGIQAQRDAGDANAGSFDQQSQAGRDNSKMLQDLLGDLEKITEETIKQSGSTDDAKAALAAFKQTMEEHAAAVGVDITKVQGYNEVVAQMERDIDIQFNTHTSDAIAALQVLQGRIAAIPRQVDIHTQIEQRLGLGYAEGGLVDHGPPGHDKVPANLTLGEFVNNVDSTRANLAALAYANEHPGARLYIAGAGGGGRSGSPSTTGMAASTTYYTGDINLNLSMQDLSQLRDLDDLLGRVDRMRNNSRRGMVMA